MERCLSLLLVLFLFLGSCSLSVRTQEPRNLKVISNTQFKQDESKINATYSYLVFLYHSNKGDVEEARKALDNTVAFDPDSSALKLEKAQDLYTRGLYASAREELLKLKSQDPDADKLFIQVLVREGNLSEARVALDKWLEKNPQDDDMYGLRARIEIEDQNIPLADKILKKFLASNPDSSEAYLLRGRVRQVQNREKEALADYKTAMELDPQNVTAAAHLAFLQDISGHQDDALKTYSLLADLTDNPEFHKRLGALYLEKSDSRRAIAALEAYARHQPNDNQNLARLAALYMELKDYEQAEFKLEVLVKQQPDNETLRFYYASALFEQNKKDKALAEIKKVKKDSTLYPERLRIELLSLWDLGQEANARQLAQASATEIMSRKLASDEALYNVLYMFFVQKKMKDEAKGILAKGLLSFPKSTQLRYSYALALDDNGQVKEALNLGQALLKEDGKNPALLNLVGYLLASQGSDLKRAEKMVELALKARPGDPFILDSKAWIKFKQNHLPEALSLLEEINKSKPDEPIIMIHLGDVLAKLGRVQDAMALYEKALTLGIDATHERLRIEEYVSRTQNSNSRKISCSPGSPSCAGQ